MPWRKKMIQNISTNSTNQHKNEKEKKTSMLNNKERK